MTGTGDHIELPESDPEPERYYDWILWKLRQKQKWTEKMNDEYIYDAEYKSLKSKLEKIDDSKYLANITNDQFKEMFETMTNENSNPEEMSDFGKGMIEMLGGMFEFATFGQKSSFEILIDGRIQKEDEMSIKMNFAEMFKGLNIPFEDGFSSSENFITTVSSYSMCKEIK